MNGLGKIVGPIALGVIAGASNVVSPRTTVAAITPGFLYIAAFSFVVFLTFAIVNVETHGRSLEAVEKELAGDGEEAASLARPRPA
jgi:putative MFS transporter